MALLNCSASGSDDCDLEMVYCSRESEESDGVNAVTVSDKRSRRNASAQCCQEIRQTRGMAAEESTQCITEHEGFSEVCLARHACITDITNWHWCYRKSIPNEENK
ncbi:hypothetical protein CAPTEDRAFT_190816 [Capitella teleta]|uniref:Uncharacterized protein n=1 Tax=Capitella teleta TaxID=283909 RepID=R7VCD2_CAPTE|nr:hypothetical protein CAPTEDRAFT_190816 [Capitella teleta]|eukprot:ELU16192.1 hypothetical protein CAPTEDRAFT_190816 [Capitella teleta]